MLIWNVTNTHEFRFRENSGQTAVFSKLSFRNNAVGGFTIDGGLTMDDETDNNNFDGVNTRGTNFTNGDPLLNDPANGDHTPGPTSPLLGSNRPDASPVLMAADIDGVSRSDPDTIGAYVET